MTEKVMPYIYFDMDGVLAKWNTKASVEDTFEEGYFLSLEPEKKAIDLIQKLHKAFGDYVRILSAVYTNGYAEKEKKEWLKKNDLSKVHATFIPYGNRKENYIEAGKPSILIDDFSQNLLTWSKIEEHEGIKFKNGINGTHGTWKGRSISKDMSVDEMMEVVLETVFALQQPELEEGK